MSQRNIVEILISSNSEYKSSNSTIGNPEINFKPISRGNNENRRNLDGISNYYQYKPLLLKFKVRMIN